ncbi:MAG: carboxylating nicotinate-nucleotide diphosphorylase [Spirochaetes bacterium]|jgi:nicotinate-nucleotide pyrophosphorylase (carboxylating)|nr:carboxylating nicotinate-nucleotide diphosphorylase [Spirochaetota bacterium]
MNSVEPKQIETLLRLAFEEDIHTGDVTGMAIFSENERSKAVVRAKESGIFCGGFMAGYVYSFLNSSVESHVRCTEGQSVVAGDTVLELEGPTIHLLGGERILLNFIQRMCGIATQTSRIVKLVEGSSIKILDTRKTLPGFRLLDKYAVAAGGGTNHRMGLYDMVMIKDNHIKSAGSIARAVELVRERWGTTYRVEVETTTEEEVREAVTAGADIIMLDNMNRQEMEQALELIDRSAEVEVSGNMSAKKIMEIRDLQVDYVSIGALTHSVEAFDLSMKFL